MTDQQKPAPVAELTQPYHFDKRAEFTDKIEPLINQLHKLCSANSIPMFALIQYASSDKFDAVFHSSVTCSPTGEPIDVTLAISVGEMLQGVLAASSRGDDKAQALLVANPLVLMANTRRGDLRARVHSRH